MTDIKSIAISVLNDNIYTLNSSGQSIISPLFKIESYQRLIIPKNYTLDISNNVTLTLNGAIINYGTLTNKGILNCNGFVNNEIGSILTNTNKIINNGICLIKSLMTNQTSGILINNSKGNFIIKNKGLFNNLHEVNNYGNYTNNGLIDNKTGGYFLNDVTILNEKFINNGIFNNEIGASFSNIGEGFANNGIINDYSNGGFHYNAENYTFTNNGVLNIQEGQTFSLNFNVINNNTINNFGILDISNGYVLTNNGIINNNLTMTNNGTFINNVKSIFKNNATGTFITSGNLTNTGIIENYNTFTNNNSSAPTYGLTNNTGGIISNYSTNFTLAPAGATYTNAGTINNNSGCNFNIHFNLVNNGNINNSGILEIFGGYTLTNNSIIVNNFTKNTSDKFLIDVNANFLTEQNARFTNNGIVTNNWFFYIIDTTGAIYNNNGTVNGITYLQSSINATIYRSNLARNDASLAYSQSLIYTQQHVTYYGQIISAFQDSLVENARNNMNFMNNIMYALKTLNVNAINDVSNCNFYKNNNDATICNQFTVLGTNFTEANTFLANIYIIYNKIVVDNNFFTTSLNTWNETLVINNKVQIIQNNLLYVSASDISTINNYFISIADNNSNILISIKQSTLDYGNLDPNAQLKQNYETNLLIVVRNLFLELKEAAKNLANAATANLIGISISLGVAGFAAEQYLNTTIAAKIAADQILETRTQERNVAYANYIVLSELAVLNYDLATYFETLSSQSSDLFLIIEYDVLAATYRVLADDYLYASIDALVIYIIASGLVVDATTNANNATAAVEVAYANKVAAFALAATATANVTAASAAAANITNV